MNVIARIIAWIDQGYDNAAGRSNYAMGLIISVTGLLALAVNIFLIKMLLATFAASVGVLFGWRMMLWFRRRASRSDRKKNSGR